MNHYEKFVNLKQFTDSVGPIYGTEDFAIYLYSIVKMTKPKTVLELGTGFGTTSLWVALALEENSVGKIYTIDDGSEWPKLESYKEKFKNLYRENYSDYIKNLFEQFELTNQIEFYNTKVEKKKIENIDILFCDFSHSPFSVVNLLVDYLPKMSENSFVFIDSASTYYSSYHTLESIVDIFNFGKIPKTFLDMVSPLDRDKFYHRVMTSKFELTHIVENKDRAQNSTAQIKITPVDIFPNPKINIRF